MPPMPPYLYHATPEANAAAIARSGLQPRSVGGAPGKYLCMAPVESRAATLGARASDIIFRVATANLKPDDWTEFGSGNKEWRSAGSISAAVLEYRRNLGTPNQKTWRGAAHYPQGIKEQK
jgi:hypothetical protein